MQTWISPRMTSRIAWMLSLKPAERRAYLSRMGATDRTALNRIVCNEWPFHWYRPENLGGARAKQRPPGGDWFLWVIRTGRGWGKTRTAAEYIRAGIDEGRWRTVNVAGPTWTDVVDTMVRGSPSAPGLAGIWPARLAPTIHLSQDDPHMVAWTGAKLRLRAAHSAERFRGPQADAGWADEVDSWRPQSMTPSEAWANFELGVRLGVDPRIVVTSTPKPARLIKELCARADAVVTTGSTLENRRNLANRFIQSIVAQYGHTRLGRQEIEGEILEEIEGAILRLAQLDESRVSEAAELARVEIGVDPSGSGSGGDEQGIVVAGRGIDGDAYVLADRSCRLSPEGWARRLVDTFHEFKADLVIAEGNYGGEMVRSTISQIDRGVPVRIVHATRGKHRRFEPISLLYEQSRVHHVGTHAQLEDQLCRFTQNGYGGDESPDRADAAVWVLTSLMVKRRVGWEDLYGGQPEERASA